MQWIDNDIDIDSAVDLWNELEMKPHIYYNKDEFGEAFFTINANGDVFFFENWDDEGSPMAEQEVRFLKRYVDKYYQMVEST